MPVRLVATFPAAEAAEQARAALQARHLASAAMVLSRRQDGPEETAGPFLTLAGADASHDRRPDRAAVTPAGADGGVTDNGDAGERLGPGAAVGGTIGGTVGALAASYMVPGTGAPALGVPPLVSSLLGAGLGSLLGAAWQAAGGEVDASRPYHPVVLGGAILVAVCPDEFADAARQALAARSPLDLREERVAPGGGDGAGTPCP